MARAVKCPRCKHVFDGNDPKASIWIEDERIMRLSDATRHVWLHAGERFWRGCPTSLNDLAQRACVDHTTARYHLRKMKEVGLVRTQSKRAGGKYVLYAGCMTKS